MQVLEAALSQDKAAVAGSLASLFGAGKEEGDVRACKRPKLHGKSMDGAVACGAAVAKEDAGFRFDFSAAS